jgi:hypothetical protein
MISDHKEKLRRANVLHFFTNASPGQLDFCEIRKTDRQWVYNVQKKLQTQKLIVVFLQVN